VEVNRTLVQIPAAVSITSSTTGWPGVGAGAYVTITAAGVITLRASTCTASTRPSDNLFQLTGGGVGYDDIGKFGYYYSATERVLAHFWEVSATAYYFINLANGLDEIGENANGSWIQNKKSLTQYVWGFLRASNSSASVNATGSYPIGFTGYPKTHSQTLLGYKANSDPASIIDISGYNGGEINRCGVLSATQYVYGYNNGATSDIYRYLWSIIAIGERY
jgi:hypothetical protein